MCNSVPAVVLVEVAVCCGQREKSESLMSAGKKNLLRQFVFFSQTEAVKGNPEVIQLKCNKEKQCEGLIFKALINKSLAYSFS